MAHRCPHRRVTGRLQRQVAPFDDDAWQPAEDNLDQASLIDSTARSIEIEESHAHTLDRRRELSQLHAQFPADVLARVLVEFDFFFANVCKAPSMSACRAASWAKPSATCSNGGPGSPASSTTRAFRSTTMPPSGCCGGRSSAGRITTARSRGGGRRWPRSSTPAARPRSRPAGIRHAYLPHAVDTALAQPGTVTLPDVLLRAPAA